MKCQNCGAEIGKGQFCQYCGSRISFDMRREQEQLNMAGCPSCGSSNVAFRREKEGEVTKRYKTGSVNQSVFVTTGICKDCGYTWQTDRSVNAVEKNNTVWWVLGWIFFFPAPVMILIWRKKNTWSTKVKILATAAFWVLFFFISARAKLTDVESKNNSSIGNNAQTNITEFDLMRDDDIEIKVGEKKSPGWVKVKVNKTSDFSIDDVVFISENTDIAEVNLTHTALSTYLYFEVIGVGAGETFIYVKSSDGSIYSEKIKVKVIGEINVNRLEIENSNQVFALGESRKLSVKFYPDNASNKEITWKSDDESVVRVDEKGNAYAVSGGSTNVTAISKNGITDTIKIDVDGTKRVMNLLTTYSRLDNNNIGDDWNYLITVNGDPVGKSFTISKNQTLNFYAKFIENDANPDIGDNSKLYKVSDIDFNKGFSVSMIINVAENSGDNSGMEASFLVIFNFAPK